MVTLIGRAAKKLEEDACKKEKELNKALSDKMGR